MAGLFLTCRLQWCFIEMHLFLASTTICKSGFDRTYQGTRTVLVLYSRTCLWICWLTLDDPASVQATVSVFVLFFLLLCTFTCSYFFGLVCTLSCPLISPLSLVCVHIFVVSSTPEFVSTFSRFDVRNFWSGL